MYKIILIAILITVAGSTLNQASAQFTDYNEHDPGITAAIPSWIKNTAGWWADGNITENEFLQAIEYLIENKIIKITATQIKDIPDITATYTLPASRQAEFPQISGSFETKHTGPLTLTIIQPDKTEQTVTTISRDGTFTATIELTSESQIGAYIVYAEIEGELILVNAFEVKDRDANKVPVWIKNNAQWWSEDKITDSDFTQGIEYLVSNKIITVQTNVINVEKTEPAPKQLSLQCSSDCLDKVFKIGAKNRGWQTIPETGVHCKAPLPDTCFGSSSDVRYYSPENDLGDTVEVRLSAIDVGFEIFTLPFTDQAPVERRGTWWYKSAEYTDRPHRAIDYFPIPEESTFKVRSVAPGTVIYKDFHWDPGNVVVISHDVVYESGGKKTIGKDVYRSIYMHLRDGNEDDCKRTWQITIPGADAENHKDLEDFKDYLDFSGCNENQMNLREDYWGTDEKIPVNVGDIVDRGQFIGWSGNTGIDSNVDIDDHNTHLHIFFTKRDVTNDAWYFIDPYGIYGKPQCYPDYNSEIISDCTRFQVHWKDGYPQFPLLLDQH